jgi:XTP/dITP diphosphohydrolase
VLSARFAGEPKSDARNNALLLERLAGEPNRGARFYCALALVRHADDPQPIIACGEWHGEILETPRGQGGFGYDPLFLVPDLDQTAAEIDHSLKNVLSHRGNAMRQLLDRLRAEQQA